MSNIFVHYLPDKKLTHFYVSAYRCDQSAWIVVIHGLDLINKFRSSFLIRTIRVRLLNCRTFLIIIKLIQFFLNCLHCPKISTRIFRIFCIGSFVVNNKSTAWRFHFSERVNYVIVLHSAKTVSIHSSLSNCRLNLKQRACMKLIIKICNNLSIAYHAISQMSRVFANGPGDLLSIADQNLLNAQKMILDAAFFNTQHYKVRIKDKVEQSREEVAPSPYTSV